MPALVTAVVGASSAIGASRSRLSARFPISQARRYDLDVGVPRRLGGARRRRAGRARRRARDRDRVGALGGERPARRSDATPSTAGRLGRAAGLPPALAIGSRLAVEPGRGRRAVPVRSALIGAIVGVLGVVGCFTFRAGLTDAAASPQRSGVVWNFLVGSGEGPIAADDAREDRATIATSTAVLHAVWYRAVRINGVPTPTFGTTTLKGDIAPVVLSGRAPRAPDEIAFGPATLRDLKLHVGDRVTVGDAPGTTRDRRRHRAAARVVAHRLRPERVDDRRRRASAWSGRSASSTRTPSRTTCS